MATSTSFNKKVKAKIPQIPGTKPSLYNNQLLVSTGIPSLDTVLGGGVAVGTVLLVEEDVGAKYADIMMRYFLAEGVVNSHALSVISANQDPQQMLERLPAPAEGVGGPESRGPKPLSQGSGDADSKMSIAWRYQNQPKVQPVATSKFGHYYNLSKSMDNQRLQSANVDCVNFSDLLAYENEHLDGTKPSTYCRYRCVLQRLRKRIEEGKFATAAKCENRNILRIGIHSLGSTLWGETGGAADRVEDQGTLLLQFLLALRDLLRMSFSVCLLTIPTYLFENIAIVKRAERLCDTVLKLDSFAASVKAKNPAFRDYSGLLHLIKFPCLNELVSHMPETLDLAFRCWRKKFTIEKLHLPPELSDTASREQDDPVPSLRPSSACSSVGPGSSRLDF